ncbi:MAG: hypothetical protein ACOC4M_15970, partial [Promethearchaeia archaeon]
GKTALALLFGYFNSEYKKQMRDEGYTKAIELMDSGLLPEIEEIIVLESENNLSKAITTGVERAFAKPFWKKDMLTIAPIGTERKEDKLEETEQSIRQKRLLIDAYKKQFDTAVRRIVDDKGPNCLFIIDSMTAYYQILKDKLGLLSDKLNDRDIPSDEAMSSMKQAHYASRNTWWEKTMTYKRKFKGWNIDTFKAKEVPDHYRDAGDPEYNIKWVPGTKHFLDMSWRVWRPPGTTRRKIEIIEGRYAPQDYSKWKFPYPLRTKMGAMPLIESMADGLLYGAS